jgi:response regulator RpfG family c-di-GMP phosphodiesterase
VYLATKPAVSGNGKREVASLKDCPPNRVLIVDDEPAACALLTVFLGQAAFDCCTALSGEEALTVLKREQVAAVISDLNMPGISGMELLAEVRRRYSHLAFLVSTAVDDVRVGVEAMQRGADDYLVKPFEEGAVVASLHRALDKKRLEQEVENYREHLEEMVAERTQQLQAALRQVERGYEDTLEALGAAIDLRDSDTAGHSQRVCRYALEIAKATGLSVTQLKNLSMGACLHDIGKLAIPDAILLKPGPLSAEEWVIMKEHVQIGYDLVSRIPFLAGAAEIIFAHHERCDGSGYPRGLTTAQIPLGARIFAIADTVDAITSDRPYQVARSFAAALELIRRESGRLFDPQVVNVFLAIPPETWPAITMHYRQVASPPFRLREPIAVP